jgi:hypothetical protein
MCPLPGGLVGLSCSIARGATVSGDLPADGRGSACKPGGYSAYRFAGHQGAGDFLSLSEGQSQLGTAALRRANATRLSQYLPDGGMRTIEQASDLVKRLALLPTLPHQRFLSLRVLGSWSFSHPHSFCFRRVACCIDQLNPPSKADIPEGAS